MGLGSCYESNNGTDLSHLGVPNHTAQLPQEKKPSRAPKGTFVFRFRGYEADVRISKDCKQT